MAETVLQGTCVGEMNGTSVRVDGSLQQGMLLEMWPHQLHPDRKPAAIKANRECQSGHACQVGRQGEYIFQVHCQRIVAVLSRPAPKPV